MRRGPVDVACDYGESTPELVCADRFGDRQDYRLSTRRRSRHILPGDIYSPIKRLGLVLKSWGRHFSGSEHYHLAINGRALEIRSYTDGRIKIFLDNDAHEVYAENWVPIHEHGRYPQQRTLRKTYADDHIAEQNALAEQRIENVRAQLNARRQELNTKKE